MAAYCCSQSPGAGALPGEETAPGTEAVADGYGGLSEAQWTVNNQVCILRPNLNQENVPIQGRSDEKVP